MLLMVVMLVIALIPTGDGWWVAADVPALCYFKRLVARNTDERFQTNPYQLPSMLISVMVLFSGYLTRVVRLSEGATAFTKLWIRIKPGRQPKQMINNSNKCRSGTRIIFYWRLKHLILETLYNVLHASFDIYESMLWEVGNQSGVLPKSCLEADVWLN